MRAPSTAEKSFDRAPASVRAARQFLTAQLAEWGEESLLWPGQQALSELASNAVLHGDGAQFTVRVGVLTGGRLRLEVVDANPILPRRRHYGPESATGRGMALVTELCREWGAEPVTDGKVVWCEIAGHPDGRASVGTSEPGRGVSVGADAVPAARPGGRPVARAA